MNGHQDSESLPKGFLLEGSLLPPFKISTFQFHHPFLSPKQFTCLKWPEGKRKQTLQPHTEILWLTEDLLQGEFHCQQYGHVKEYLGKYYYKIKSSIKQHTYHQATAHKVTDLEVLLTEHCPPNPARCVTCSCPLLPVDSVPLGCRVPLHHPVDVLSFHCICYVTLHLPADAQFQWSFVELHFSAKQKLDSVYKLLVFQPVFLRW